MSILHKTSIKGFDYPLFVTAFARDQNMAELEISPQLGIRNASFIAKCKEKFREFSNLHEYSRSTVEKFFGIRFCVLRVVNGKIRSFEEKPRFGNNVIFLHRK